MHLSLNDPNRGTGRTTRMMEAAVQAAVDGKHVAMVFATHDQARKAIRTASTAVEMMEINTGPVHLASKIKFELCGPGRGSIEGFSVSEKRVNMTKLDVSPKLGSRDGDFDHCYFDHAAIDAHFTQQFEPFLNAAHRFDKVEEPADKHAAEDRETRERDFLGIRP